MGSRWRLLNRTEIPQLVEARFEAHYATNLLTRITRAYLPHQPDDSHTALVWDDERSALATQAVSAAGVELRPALRIQDLALLVGEEHRLAGETVAGALAWLQDAMKARGLDPELLLDPLHFEIPDHPLAHGSTFAAPGSLGELSRYFANAAAALEQVRERNPEASPVRCWPHHFDIATLISVPTPVGEDSRSVGVGLSPGDGGYAEPYWYVTPWPYPPADQLPALPAGAWHTEGWVGAVLTAGELATPESAEAQASLCTGFLAEAVRQARSLVS